VKLAHIETFRVPPRWLFVRVESDDGAVGWGEGSLEGHAEAVEGALWDLKGKALRLPVWEMLGGRVRERVQAYAWIGGDRPQEVAEAARSRRAQGFKAVKMNATAELGYLESPKVLDGVLARLGAAQGEGLDVALDFHGRVHKAMAKPLLKLLEPYRPLFVEEPLLSEHPEALRELAQVSSVPIALGERLYTRWGFKPFLTSGLVDVIQPDLAHAGGILEVKKIAAMAEAFDVAVAPHCPLGPLALAASLQVAAGTPNVVLQEMSLGIHYHGAHDLLSYLEDPQVLTPQDGFLSIPEGPGLGVTLDEEKVREASREGHRWRNPVWRHEDGSLAEW